MKQLLTLSLLFFCSSWIVNAQVLQQGVLKPKLFFDVRISEAEVISSSAERVILSLNYDLRQDRKYTISGVALNSDGDRIAELQTSAQELAVGEGVLDMTFQFEQKSGQSYIDPQLEIAFIQIQIHRDLGLGKIFRNESSSRGVPSATFTYAFQHTWRVAGNEGMTIEVTLQPIGRARGIRP